MYTSQLPERPGKQTSFWMCGLTRLVKYPEADQSLLATLLLEKESVISKSHNIPRSDSGPLSGRWPLVGGRQPELGESVPLAHFGRLPSFTLRSAQEQLILPNYLDHPLR